jgi:UDP-N-acetylmuramoylalanine--D-glutamate ligase
MLRFAQDDGQVSEQFRGKRVHVIGLGSWGTGRAVARALWRRGAQVTVSDVKPAAELAQEIARLSDTDVVIQAGDKAYRGIEEADLVVPSPGVPLSLPPLLRARDRGARVVSEIEVAYWLAPCPMIAVTGTKGKTTTTALIGELLRDAGMQALVGGNIGRPLLELAETAQPESILVAEVSSFQLEATEQFRPRVAVLLNLSADHLDRHESMQAYREAKIRLFANQLPEDVAVVNRDDAEAWALRERTRAQVRPYSLRQAEPNGADVEGGWLRLGGERICPTGDLGLRGRHNLGNALAALLAVQAVGASLMQARDTLRRFAGVEHRLEVVATVNGVLFVNDSQATTPEAAVAGLEAFEERVILIAGGRPKVPDFRGLAEAMARRRAALVVMGEAAEEIAAAARAAGVKSIAHAKDLASAVELASRQAEPGDVVLLSPACASFDMFANMAERGRRFKELVMAWAARRSGEKR